MSCDGNPGRLTRPWPPSSERTCVQSKLGSGYARGPHDQFRGRRAARSRPPPRARQAYPDCFTSVLAATEDARPRLARTKDSLPPIHAYGFGDERLKTELKLHTVRGVSGQDLAALTELFRLPERDCQSIMPLPATRIHPAAIEVHVAEHIPWRLRLARKDVTLLAAALLSAPWRRPRLRGDRNSRPTRTRPGWSRPAAGPCRPACSRSQCTSGGSKTPASPSGPPYAPRLMTGASRTRDHGRQRCTGSA